MKTTKAPWRVVIVETFDSISYSIQQDKSEHDDDPEAIANKHLIQAAPFLRDELRHALALLINKYGAEDDEVLSMQHALARADGKL